MNPVVENYAVQGTERRICRYKNVFKSYRVTTGRNLLQHNFALSG